jgi:hypothetical protein
MPNTLAHMGLGGSATRFFFRDADLKWAFTGCILPDVPWILQRASRVFAPGADPYHVLYYSTIQASLAFCLLLGAALAALSSRFWRAFAILGLNALFHLLLDACELKWASGVHFFAPFSWRFVNFGLIELQGVGVFLLTALGVVVYAATWRRSVAAPPDLLFQPRGRVVAAAGLLCAYILLPLAFLHGPERADNHFAKTLLARAERPGRPVEFDRAVFLPSPTGNRIRIFSGEELQIEGVTNDQPAAISVRGSFVAENRVRAIEYRITSSRFRDGASKVGLFLVGLLWLVSAVRARSPRTFSA